MASTYTFVPAPIEFGNDLSGFWVEYPSGLVDLSRSHHISEGTLLGTQPNAPPLKAGQADICAEKGRTVRIDTKASAMVIIDMQKSVSHQWQYFADFTLANRDVDLRLPIAFFYIQN